MAVEFEPQGLRRDHQPVEVPVDVEDALVGIEAHRLDEIHCLSGIGHIAPNPRRGPERQAPAIARPGPTS